MPRSGEAPPQPNHENSTLSQPSHWVEEYSSQYQEIWQREAELKQEYAKRLSCDPLPNIYKLHSPASMKSQVNLWKRERGILQRKDLMPTVTQDAGRDKNLWVRNILKRSSCDVSSVTVEGTRIHSPVILLPPDENTIQSISTGDVVVWPVPPPPLPLAPPLPPLSPRVPEHIVCVPPKLDFINFTVGRVHAQSIRLVNTSKLEVRLSVRPPRSAELLVEMVSSRGLCVTSGAAARLRVHFRPQDVRSLHDCLVVRVSTGGELCLPIHCYIQPPLLHILVPSVSSSVFSCTPEDADMCQSRSRGCDVLELGARLLGDDHYVELIFHCESDHASFFLLTEEDWLSFCINSVSSEGAVVCGALSVSPAWWSGGGTVRAQCRWRARHPGLQVAQFRLLCSTGITRPLHVLADALFYRPEHFTLLAHEKDYDICSEGDPGCEYYVHLGTAFPGRALAAAVQLLNHSPVTYTYCWNERPWGVCSCWEEEKGMEESLGPEDNSERLCIGALETRDRMKEGSYMNKGEAAGLVRVEPARGEMAPRSSCAVHVCAPDVGTSLGLHRSVLMFILKSIPKDSLPSDYDPMIMSSTTVESEPMPGVQNYTSRREVCDLVCFQLEVWWEVVPLRFVLDPPVLPLFHSLRVQQVEVLVQGAQLFGCEPIQGWWSLPEHVLCPPNSAPAGLTPAHSTPFRIQLQLPTLPQHGVQHDLFTLVALNEEWKSECAVSRQCRARDATLRPAITWLGVVPSRAHLHTAFHITNDTYHELEWRGTCLRWVGAQHEYRACDPCQHSACSCELLHPAAGLLAVGETGTMHYNVNAPQRDGLLATLVRSGGRAALVAARSLAPRLMLRVLPCSGNTGSECGGCSLDEGGRKSKHGFSTLRPRAALVLAHRTCYRLRLSNLTPLPTSVLWDSPSLEDDDILKVIFIPNCFNVGGHAAVEIKVVLEGRAVCGRRVFLRSARVAGASEPLYLVIDAAIAGLEVICEMPTGADINTDSVVVIRRTQREKFPWDVDKPSPSHPVSVSTPSPEEIFSEHDRLRDLQKEHTCHCPYKMLYIPPVKRPRPPPRDPDDYPPVEIVLEPPRLSRVCACAGTAKPTLPDPLPPCCLQFTRLPLRTVRSRSLLVRNESVQNARWSATARYYPRHHHRTLLPDKWAGDVGPAGLVVECSPRSGMLGPRGQFRLHVRVYADCWGLYREQLLLQIEKLDPIVVDVWVEAVGPPLQFVLKPADTYGAGASEPVLWLSASDPGRRLHARNVSRSELTLHAYTLTEHEHDQDVLPLRLYLRLFDVPPRSCPCVTACTSELDGEHTGDTQSSYTEEMDTGVELYLAADHGIQTNAYFQVSPQVLNVLAGGRGEWSVTLRVPEHCEVAPRTKLLFRILPVNRSGVRKRFEVRNIGNGPMELNAHTSAPWAVVRELQHEDHCGSRCPAAMELATGERLDHVALYLEPRSSTQICVEVSLRAEEPSPEETQRCLSVRTTPLHFYDTDNLLLKLSLVVELEYPALRVEPPLIDFGCVTDGNTRKSYFTVSHSSPTKTLALVTQWIGDEEFELWPQSLQLQPGGCGRVYVQYTARWCGAPAEGCARVSCAGAAGWCSAGVQCRASPARDHKCSAMPHDHTDDARLLPHDISY